MEKIVQELKTIMRELIIEVGELKEKVAYLEKNYNYEESNKESTLHKPDFNSLKLEGEGYENLGRIYNQGYHICSMAYGQPRSGECLFCIAFLEKE